MTSTTSGNSRLAGKAARNCASGCTRSASRAQPDPDADRHPDQAGQRDQHDDAQQREQPEPERRADIAQASVGGDEVDDPPTAPRPSDGEHGRQPERIDQRATAARLGTPRRRRQARARSPPSADDRVADGIGRARLQQPRAAHQSQHPGVGGRRARGLLEAEFVGPGDERAKQQLVVGQDHQPAWPGWRSRSRRCRAARCASAT